ncbi:MAG TPA: PIG-L family deacetylase [Thermoanaerobaculia bacterium]|nr:PIG-L family deacetylase [Thermoanaerobaculia bacterium]
MAVPESEAIPYEALNLRGERLLVLAPHPDDEVIGCGGVVFQHLRDGRQVRVAVATDGVEAAPADDRDAYRAKREEESRRALPAAFDFFRFPDRALDDHRDDLAARLRDVLDSYRPDLILAPSAIEIHPDHLALARCFCELIQRDPSLFADLAVARVAFYEVSQPLRPNVLVDITGVAAAKYDAIAAHSSQTEIRDYVSFARGLNVYRAMTLAPEVRFAEAYWVTSLPSLRTTPFSALRDAMGAPPPLDVVAEPKPISVVIRTKDRPALLREAIDSVRATGYPAEIVVVNDGGARVDAEGVKLVEHETSRGRSEAANAGVRTASSDFVVFLDDDDLMYPEHLSTLAGGTSPCYSDAVSSFAHARMRIYSRDFDRDLLLLDNYIPLPTVLIRRADFLDLGGFDPAFDLFEDWDFLIRLAQRAPFTHLPRITCEIRHIEGAGSITMSTPAGSQRFRDAKLQVWRKHAALIDHDTIANAFEREKQRTLAIESALTEAKGLRGHFEQNIDRLQRDAARLEGDKATLIAELQRQHERLDEMAMHKCALEGTVEELRNALGLAQKERNELLIRVGELGDARAGFEESQRTITALYAEIARLQGTLDSIFQSRTWKLHSMVEKMKGRG